MSLILSVQTPDGIVIAGDSLSTMRNAFQMEGDIEVQCPNCGDIHQQRVNTPQVQMPSTTMPYARKLFPFMDDFGVGTFGAGQLNGKTMYFAVRELEEELVADDKVVESVTNAADRIGNRAHELLEEQVDTSTDDIPSDEMVVGFQVVGYGSDGTPETTQVEVGNDVDLNKRDDEMIASGRVEVVNALHEVWDNQGAGPAYQVFSLQDAVNYAEFMIRTTSNHQEFSQRMPTVGGAIDIALVTPFDGFQWVRQKDLSQTIEQNRYD
ncbi:hypothetical protein [Salinibacter altiplanensis]|uniref:hypothetical protein n=1 Tax=Salinibacter altiplanensis TaxID=1803181 RepID=UPI0012FFDEC3|nr:hypothetical protein [Salinibacter altiplanensis]